MKNMIKYFLVLALGIVQSQAADLFKADPVHSNIEFTVRHLGISSVSGKFTEFSADIWVDEVHPENSSVDVTIQVSSIDTDNERRDAHLRSKDFFDVEEFPTITFKSTRVDKEGDGYVLHGNLTMHGVTQEIAFPFTADGPKELGQFGIRLGSEANLSIKRSDYDISFGLGELAVSDEVKINLSISAVKEG